MVEREEERGEGDKVMNVMELDNAVTKFVLLPIAPRCNDCGGARTLLRNPLKLFSALHMQSF